MGVLHLPPAVGEIAGALDSKNSPGNSPNGISAHIPMGEAHINRT